MRRRRRGSSSSSSGGGGRPNLLQLQQGQQSGADCKVHLATGLHVKLLRPMFLQLGATPRDVAEIGMACITALGSSLAAHRVAQTELPSSASLAGALLCFCAALFLRCSFFGIPPPPLQLWKIHPCTWEEKSEPVPDVRIGEVGRPRSRICHARRAFGALLVSLSWSVSIGLSLLVCLYGSVALAPEPCWTHG